MFRQILAFLRGKPKECDHVYFPVMMGDKPIGQECAICHKFNSLKDVLDSTTNEDRHERSANAKQR